MALLRCFPTAYVSGTGSISNPANIVGDTLTYLSQTSATPAGALVNVRVTMDFSSIPSDAIPHTLRFVISAKAAAVSRRNFTGITLRYQNGASVVTYATAAAQALIASDGTYAIEVAWSVLEANGWTLEMLRTGPNNSFELEMTSVVSTSTLVSLQKMYVDVDYSPAGCETLRLFPTVLISSVYTNGSDVLGNTDLEASRLAANTTDAPTIVVGFPLSQIPAEAVSVESFTLEAQVRQSVTAKRRVFQFDAYGGGSTLFLQQPNKIFSAVSTTGPEWVHQLVNKPFGGGASVATMRGWDTTAEWTLTTSNVDATSVTAYVRRMRLHIDYKMPTAELGNSFFFAPNF